VDQQALVDLVSEIDRDGNRRPSLSLFARWMLARFRNRFDNGSGTPIMAHVDVRLLPNATPDMTAEV
jgi:hypothetical protein